MHDQNLQAEFIESLLSQIEASCVKPASRMQIYHHNIEHTLLNTLRQTYRITDNLVGHQCFTQVAKSYTQNYPSTSSNLNDYGEFFNVFIANHPNTSHLPYLQDICTFEWIHHILHDAPTHTPLCLEKINFNALNEETLQLEMLPASRLMHSIYPLIDIAEIGLRHKQESIQLTTSDIYLLIYRPELNIKTLILNAEEFAFFSSISTNQTLKSALLTAQSINPNFSLAEKLPLWVQQNIIINFYDSHENNSHPSY